MVDASATRIIQPSQYKRRRQLIFWSRILPISVIHLLWWRMMHQSLRQMNVKNIVKREELFISQVPHIIPLQRSSGKVGSNLQAESQQVWQSAKRSSVRVFDTAPATTYCKFIERTPEQSSDLHQVWYFASLSWTPTVTQGTQARLATNAQSNEVIRTIASFCKVEDPWYALYYGPNHSQHARWVPAIVTKRHGTLSVNIPVLPWVPTWRRHVEQILPLNATEDDVLPKDDRRDVQALVSLRHEPIPLLVNSIDFSSCQFHRLLALQPQGVENHQ